MPLATARFAVRSRWLRAATAVAGRVLPGVVFVVRPARPMRKRRCAEAPTDATRNEIGRPQDDPKQSEIPDFEPTPLTPVAAATNLKFSLTQYPRQRQMQGGQKRPFQNLFAVLGPAEWQRGNEGGSHALPRGTGLLSKSSGRKAVWVQVPPPVFGSHRRQRSAVGPSRSRGESWVAEWAQNVFAPGGSG